MRKILCPGRCYFHLLFLNDDLHFHPNKMLAYIDFSTPVWLTNFYHIAGTISLVINSYVLFLVIFKSDKMDNFKYFLLAFQFFCLTVDVHLTLLMQPQSLHPMPGGFCTGVLGENRRVSCQHLMTALSCLMAIQFAALALCFFRKFVSLITIERRELPLWKRNFVVLSMAFLTIVIVSLFHLLGHSEQESLDVVSKVTSSFSMFPSP